MKTQDDNQAIAVATTAPEAEKLADNVVVLDEPIKRTGQTIDRLTLRKPQSGELRGIALADLLNLDVTAIIKVLPRISTPTITEPEARALDLADLTDAGGKIASFLLKKSAKAELFPAA